MKQKLNNAFFPQQTFKNQQSCNLIWQNLTALRNWFTNVTVSAKFLNQLRSTVYVQLFKPFAIYWKILATLIKLWRKQLCSIFLDLYRRRFEYNSPKLTLELGCFRSWFVLCSHVIPLEPAQFKCFWWHKVFGPVGQHLQMFWIVLFSAIL
jgi:hypothetical protein